jgi:hypothetical protein
VELQLQHMKSAGELRSVNPGASWFSNYKVIRTAPQTTAMIGPDPVARMTKPPTEADFLYVETRKIFSVQHN